MRKSLTASALDGGHSREGRLSEEDRSARYWFVMRGAQRALSAAVAHIAFDAHLVRVALLLASGWIVAIALAVTTLAMVTAAVRSRSVGLGAPAEDARPDSLVIPGGTSARSLDPAGAGYTR